MSLPKVVFFSSSDFCVPILNTLKASQEIELIGVITQPDWTNRNKTYSNPIATFCKKNNIVLFQPNKLNTSVKELIATFPNIDIGVVASYGQIISGKILNLPKHGMINWHPSRLPMYRGPTPIQSSLLNGDSKGCLTWIKMDTGMDSGPVISKYEIDYLNRNFEDLANAFGELGSKTVNQTILTAMSSDFNPQPQDNTKATYTKMINKDDAFIIPSKLSNKEIFNHFNAYYRFPKTKINSVKFGEIKLIKILNLNFAEIKIDDEDSEFYYSKGVNILKTKDGAILVQELQTSNGRIIKSSNVNN